MDWWLSVLAVASQRWFAWTTFLLALAAAIGMALVSEPLRTSAAPSGMASLQMAWTADDAARIIGSWTDKAPARTNLWIDFAFLVLYAAWLCHLGAAGAERAEAAGWHRLARAARLAAAGGLLAGAADALENVGLLAMLGGSRGSVPYLTSLAATAKFALIGISLAVGGFARLVCLVPPPAAGEVSWTSMLRTARAVFGTLVVTGLALILPQQTEDMLAGHGDSVQGLGTAAAFHGMLAFLAFSAWFWSRSVLAARLRIADSRNSREEFSWQPAPGSAARKIDRQAFERIPRLLALAVAIIGAAAALRSGAWITLGIVVAWTALGAWFLIDRLNLLTPRPLSGPLPRPFWLRLMPMAVWTTIDDLSRYAPWGRRLALTLLVAAAVAFLGATVETLVVGSARLPDWLGTWLPGPAAALGALALAMGALTVLIYATDRIRLCGTLFGIPWNLSRPPVMTALLLVILVVPSLVPLHIVRVVDESAMVASPGQRLSLGEFFGKWVESCWRGGPG
jgi:hypothetical protein